MTLLSEENFDRCYSTAWILCAVTLPWSIPANNVSLALLVLLGLADGQFAQKIKKLKNSFWIWMFIGFYAILVIQTVRTSNAEDSGFEAGQKITFILLPVIAATGRVSSQLFRSIAHGFVYSCFAIVIISLVASSIHYFSNAPVENFDPGTAASYTLLHPSASPLWMHFSYIQLLKWIDLHPTYFSMYLVFCLFLLIDDIPKNLVVARIHQLIGVIISVFIILLSSRTTIIALVLCLLYLVFKNRYEKKKESLLQAAGIVGILLLALWVSPVSKFRIFEEPALTDYQLNKGVWNSVNYRLLEWKASFSVIEQNPIFGTGPAESQKAMNDYYRHFGETTATVNYNAHNQFLQTWMEAGVLGLATLLACLFAPVLYLPMGRLQVAFLLIFGVICLTESLLERQKGIVFFTLFQSLLIACQKNNR
jgi:O-antigen ligase